jgi:hypothetical protein
MPGTEQRAIFRAHINETTALKHSMPISDGA